MAYFDYSATTPCDAEISKALAEADRKYYANPNSSHALGRETRAFIDSCIASMKEHLGLKDEEIIFTGGASESNNLAVKGLAALYPDKKHIISSEIEHSSIISPLTYLMKQGYDIDFVPLDEHGRYDLNTLETLLRVDTLLVTLVAVDSETGIRQPVEEAAALTQKHGILFHCDVTQALGKTAIDLKTFDLSSFSIHKFYGPKGIGGLIRKKGLELIPLTQGGKSLTNARSGTPATSFVAAAAKAAALYLPVREERYQRVSSINKRIREALSGIPNIAFNSNEFGIPQILNLSIVGKDSDAMVDRLSEQGIYLTARSACSGREGFSKSVYAITKDNARATSSLRVSLSHLTSDAEVGQLLDALKRLAAE